VLPPLPVLSDANWHSERGWHAYVARVYGSPLASGQQLDLNTFTWFYTSLLGNDEAQAATAERDRCDDSACTSLGNDCCAPGDQPRTCSGGLRTVDLRGACFEHPDARYTCCPRGVDDQAVVAQDALSRSVLPGQSNNPPEKLISGSDCLEVCVTGLSTPTYEGTPWVGRGTAASAWFVHIGYFVRRPLPEPRAFQANCRHLEVSHVRSTYQGGEKGVSWFFATVGSGVFIDCSQLPTRGRVVAVRDRNDFGRVERETWQNDEGFPAQWMKRKNVAMVVFTQADFAHYGFDSGANPRTEIIVRHENEWSREVDAGERGVCLDTRGVSIKTFSGWHGSQRCNCQPLRKAGYSFLNCA